MALSVALVDTVFLVDTELAELALLAALVVLQLKQPMHQVQLVIFLLLIK